MVNTVLAFLSKQGHVGFRSMSRRSATYCTDAARSYCSTSAALQQQPIPMMVFSSSPSLLRTAAACYHIHYHDRRPTSSPRLQPYNVSTAPRSNSYHGDGTGDGWLNAPTQVQFQQIDKTKTSCRIFASKSNSHVHSNPDASRKRSGQRPPQKRQQQNDLFTVSDILDDYMKRREKLKPHELAATWNKLGKAIQNSRRREERQSFWVDHKAILQTLVDQTIQKSADEFNGRSTATVTHSLAKLLHLTDLKRLGGGLQSLWGILHTRTQLLLLRSNSFNAQEISNIIWAYGKADGLIKVDDRLLDALAKTALNNIADFEPQSLSNMVWSFATMSHEAPSLFDAIASAAQARINEFKPQELSNMVWSFATLKHEAPALLDDIASAAPLRINEFKPQELSNMVWSFATMNHEAPSLFDAIASAAQARINEFKPQGLSNMVWSFATMSHEAPSLFDAIAKAAPVRINEFNPQDLFNTSWAYATLNHEAPLLFDAIAQAASVCIRDFNPQELANTAWSFAKLSHNAPLLFDAIARAAQIRINDFNPQELANTAWSFAVFNIEPHSFIPANSQFAQTLLSRDPSMFFGVEELCQLHQFLLWCKEQTGAACSWFPVERSQQCRKAFVADEVAPSRLQNDVVAALEKLQDVSHVEVEVLTESGYSIDAVAVFQGNRIGIEVDGPSHFVGQSQSPNGATLLKQRQLRALEDWKLVSIPYWEWNEIDKKGSSKERRENKGLYLQKKLLDGTSLAVSSR
jgi:RAP domain/FAST kinase-like protein, subdomain 1